VNVLEKKDLFCP